MSGEVRQSAETGRRPMVGADYRADWPDLVVAMDDDRARATLMRARKDHPCIVDGLDLGAAPAHWGGISPGDAYVRITTFDGGAPDSAAVCINCASMFGGTTAGRLADAAMERVTPPDSPRPDGTGR